jgi:DNA repair protein RadA/Sms
MTQTGLSQVKNPSELFLGDRINNIAGTCVFGGMEGTRPLLIEIQALVAPSPFGTPRRAVIGWDTGRLAMVTAVLEARCNISFSGKDIFLNVAGGLKISEPGADLAVATAILSALYNIPAPNNCVIFGEIGLSAEVRTISHTDARIKEAAKLGFKKAFIPRQKSGFPKIKDIADINYHEISDLNILVKIFNE